VRLEIGALANHLEVLDSAPPVESSTTSVGQVIDQRTVQEIPLNGPGRIATVGSTSFGVITATRFPTGDSGVARQIQLAAKVLF
jgi:hypothetical protein